MKYLLAVLLTGLLLAGCSADSPAPETTAPTQTQTVEETVPSQGLWDAGSAMEIATNGAVRVYPLQCSDAYALYTMGESLLVLSGMETTRLTRLAGETLQITASVELEIFLDPASLTVTANTLSYQDALRRQLVVLDASLKEIRHIALPADQRRTALLSPDQDTLYYTTDSSLKAWDLTTDIHRLVKETAADPHTLLGLTGQEPLLLCAAGDGIQVIHSRDGSLAWTGEELTLSVTNEGYYATLPAGTAQMLVFWQGEDSPTALTPTDPTARGTFLPRHKAAITASLSSGVPVLDYYRLSTGRRAASLSLSEGAALLGVDATSEGWVYLLVDDPAYGGQAVYRWDPAATPVNDPTIRTGSYYTADAPDYHGLISCQAEADRIGEALGIEILLWDDAVDAAPEDHKLEAEYLVPVLQGALSQLVQHLSQFPEGFLATTAANFSSLKLCLVRSITPQPGAGSSESTRGIQYYSGTDACIAIALTPGWEQALDHQLYHVMETQILNDSIALDQWEKLNPVDFAYDYSYTANETRDVGGYLDADIRSFVDRYSMSFPKEDRARLFEYAMADGNEALFAASPLQYKLRQLCQGIREAYGLRKHPESLPWEQYLNQPLAYSK